MSPDARSKSRWKIEDIRKFVRSSKGFIPVISITETYLKSYISKAQVKIPGYEVFRCDRESRTRGGCLVYIHEDIAVGEKFDLDNKFCNVLIVPLKKVSTAIITVYRPPNAPVSKFKEVTYFIQDYIKSVDDTWTFVINGDLNFPNIKWDSLSVQPGLSSDENTQAKIFLDLLEKNNLSQFVDASTRFCDTTENTLDLLISNSPEIILDVRGEETSLSDHELMTATLGCDFSPSKVSNHKDRPFNFSWFDFNKANFAQLNAYIENTDWDSLIINNPNNFAQTFLQTLKKMCLLSVPIKKCFDGSTSKPSKKKCEITGLKRKQKQMRCRLRALEAVDPESSKISMLKSKLTDIDSKIKNKLTLARHKEEKAAVDSIKSNPRFFYSYARRFSKVKSRVGPLKGANSRIISDPKEMADLLQNQFCSIFSDPNSPEKKVPDFTSIGVSLDNFSFTVEDIKAAIDEIKINSAPGEDEVPAVLLKNCKESVCLPLFLLWQHSFENNFIDPCFLSQLITPIYKGGSKMEEKNYRPVSLTSHQIKIFERVIHKKIVEYLEENSLLSSNQHGFRKGCSCLSELLAHFDFLYENLSNSHDSDTIYLDFSKAFDTVDHALLINKLKLYGINGKLLAWITSFLTNRIQKVVVNGQVSYIAPVISGVPQGTVLGPLLFLLYLNDLEQCICHSKVKLFADDSRLIKKVHPTVETADQAKLQSDLDAVLSWAQCNNMRLNEGKFQYICHRVHKHAPCINMRLFQQLPFADCGIEMRSYSLPNDKSLESIEDVPDLGVIVSDNFSFETHINLIVKKAGMKCGWILSVFETRDQVPMLDLFKSLVLNIVEYCCPLWSPHKIEEIAKIEEVQRRFTAKINSVWHLDYWDRLKHLKLYSLQRRRERYILLYMWKLIHEKVPNDVKVSWQVCDRKGIIAVVPRIPSSVMKINSSYDNFFKVKGAKLWNVLPKTVNSANSLHVFKEKLDSFLRDITDSPPVTGYTPANNNSLLDWLGYSSAF